MLYYAILKGLRAPGGPAGAGRKSEGDVSFVISSRGGEAGNHCRSVKDATAATVAPLFDQETSVVRSAGSIFGSHRWSSSSFSAMVSFCLSIRGILIRHIFR